MLKIFVVGVAALLAALLPAQAESTEPTNTVAHAYAPNKTSDRTPDNPSPTRAPGASTWGAAGTDVAKTTDGTSDRTPSNHYKPRAF